MKKLILAVAVLSLTGCANDFASTNMAIAQSNADKFAAYGEAMRACGANAACQVGVSMALATGAGDTKMIQPERTAEIAAAFVPFASLGLQGLGLFYGGGVSGTGSAGYVVTGDNNTFSGNGNNLESTGGSSLSAPFSSSNNFSWSTNNRDYNLGAGYEGAVVDTGVTGDLAEVPVATVTE